MTSTTCRICDASLRNGTSSESDEKQTLESSKQPYKVEYDGSKRFITCPQCSAKNIVILSTDPDGNSVITITRAIMDDD